MNNMKNLGKDIKTVLITKEQIEKRVEELGRQITKDYEGKDVVLVGILKGAMPFLCDLMRSIDLPVTLDTMCVSSYGNSTDSSGHENYHERPGTPSQTDGRCFCGTGHLS